MSYWSGDYFGWAPRKTAAARRADAARQIKDAARRGRAMSPVAIAGRKIAQTFWGKAWCDNLERYRDFAYRLERGRSYLRSGSVIDLQIEAGKIVAKVMGSSLYDVAIDIDAVQQAAWRAIQRDCAGSIGSRLDLLSGRLSEPVMARLCADRTGLFPTPSAIRFTCSCPDYATMCKHVAAVMYGVGARLDHAPDMLFTLRRASADELIASAITELPAAPSSGRVLAADGLAALFGIELADPATPATGEPAKRRSKSVTSAAGEPAKRRNKSVTSATGEPAKRRSKSVTETVRKPAAPGRTKLARAATGNGAATVHTKPAGRAAASSSKTTARATNAAPSGKQAPPPTKQLALKAKQLALQAKQLALQAKPAARPAKQPGPGVRGRSK